MRQLAWVVIAVAVMAPQRIALAQADPAFEVSSAGTLPLKGARSPARPSRTPQRIAFQAALVPDLMAFAYGFPLDRIERRPQWMYDDLYNVAVTTSAPASLPEQKLMLQKLLEERFGLMVHRVSNPSPVYYLVAGPNVKLTKSEQGDSEDAPEFGCNPGPRPQPGELVHPGRPACLWHASMSDLAAWLYEQVRLPVLDKTGITGLFDLEISGLPPGYGGAERAIPAVRNSLGLDLEVHRGTAESLIIAHAEKPSQN